MEKLTVTDGLYCIVDGAVLPIKNIQRIDGARHFAVGCAKVAIGKEALGAIVNAPEPPRGYFQFCKVSMATGQIVERYPTTGSSFETASDGSIRISTARLCRDEMSPKDGFVWTIQWFKS